MPLGSFRTRSSPFWVIKKTCRYKPSCLTALWTQIMYRFNGRTVQPLLAAAPAGSGNSTSRWQTSSSIRTLGRHYTVIPSVTLLMIADSPIRYLRVTIINFRSCSFYLTHSLAHLYYCALPFISIKGEWTYISLCYSLKGDHPNQTVFLYFFPNIIG